MKKLLALVVVSGIVNIAAGMINPAMVYCEELGYKITVVKTPYGERGICQLPDGSNCSHWDFLEGKCGQEHSYCQREGYEMKTVHDLEKCPFSEDCAVCILKDGREVEVTQLMGLFEEEKEQPKTPWFLTPLILAALVIVIVLVVLSKLRKK